ncbi:reverse transcriptase domain-containing protein, partial [Tanacetum coccineum]
GAILGQKDGKNFHLIYFARKTLNAAQQNYTITEKELMAILFAFDKFRSYLILLLQEFYIEIKDRKGTEYIADDHLSQIENDETSDDSEVDDNFPGETLMEMNTEDEQWFADFANYLPYALWDFRTAYKTPTGTTPYKLVYGKNCHLPFEIKHRTYWALKNCNPYLIAVGEKRMFQLHELDELRHQAYENSHLYKVPTFGSLEVIPSSKEIKFKYLRSLESKLEEKKRLKAEKDPINTARQNPSSQAAETKTTRKVNTARPIVNEIRQRNNFYKSHSLIRRPFNRTTTPKANFINHKVNTAEDKTVSDVKGYRETVVKASTG